MSKQSKLCLSRSTSYCVCSTHLRCVISESMKRRLSLCDARRRRCSVSPTTKAQVRKFFLRGAAWMEFVRGWQKLRTAAAAAGKSGLLGRLGWTDVENEMRTLSSGEPPPLCSLVYVEGGTAHTPLAESSAHASAFRVG